MKQVSRTTSLEVSIGSLTVGDLLDLVEDVFERDTPVRVRVTPADRPGIDVATITLEVTENVDRPSAD